MVDTRTLQEALDCGILNIDEELLRQKIEMTTKERILKNHPYAITKQPDGRWQTYFKKSDGTKRICIKLSTKEKVIDRLVALYKDEQHLDNLTFHRLFDEWIAYKASVTDSPNTIHRHRQHYNRYFRESPFFKKTVKAVTLMELQVFCNSLVKDNRLSAKEWTNVKTILKGMYEYGFSKRLIPENLMQDVKITVKFRQVQRKNGTTETFNTDEKTALIEYLDQYYLKTKDLGALAIKLNFYIGLRVGELVALKASDVVDGRYLHIVRQEYRDQRTYTFSVADHTKTHQDRYVPLVPKAIEIMNEILERAAGQEYLFERGGERITSRQITYILEKYASKSKIPAKRSHKIRKTFASSLNANGVPVDTIRECLGHSTLQTTMAYLYDPLTSDESYKRIAMAL